MERQYRNRAEVTAKLVFVNFVINVFWTNRGTSDQINDLYANKSVTKYKYAERNPLRENKFFSAWRGALHKSIK